MKRYQKLRQRDMKGKDKSCLVNEQQNPPYLIC
jgi:hypothetical protein